VHHSTLGLRVIKKKNLVVLAEGGEQPLHLLSGQLPVHLFVIDRNYITDPLH